MSELLSNALAAGRRFLAGSGPSFAGGTMSEVALPATSAREVATIGWRQISMICLGPALVVAALISLHSEHLAHPGFRAAYIVATIAAPVLIGLAWGARRPRSRIGPLLVALGYVTWVMAWQGGDAPALFVLGIAAEPILAVLTLHVALSFPSGRLGALTDRVTMGAWTLVVAVGWLGSILFVTDLGPASPLSACVPSCPPNPFALGALSAGGQQLGWALLAIAGLFVIVRALIALSRGLRGATPAQRRELLPVFAVAVFYLGAFALHHGARFIGPSTELQDATEGLMVAARLGFPFGFLGALLAAELFAVDSSRRLAANLSSPASASEIEQRLASAVHDLSLRLGIWDVRAHVYRGSEGETLSRAGTADDQIWISVRDDGERLAGVATDAGLGATPQLIAALSTAALIEVRALVSGQQSDALRARAVEASDTERKRIARDLHDSAQQRLVALRVQMMLASEGLEKLDRNREIADHLATELDLAILDLRQLARRFLAPTALENGIVPAVRALAEHWPIRVTVRARGLMRHPAEVELAVYNCCLEALQNVADHAGTGASVDVRLIERRAGIHFVVADDGVGFDPALTERGAGLARIVDRAVLAGGCAAIRTAPGRGVRVSGLIPAPETAHAA